MLDNTFKAAFPFESKQKKLIEVSVHLDFVDRYLKYEARECEGKSTTIIRSQQRSEKEKKSYKSIPLCIQNKYFGL